MRLSDAVVLLEAGRVVRASAPDEELLEFIEDRFLGLNALAEGDRTSSADSIRGQGVSSRTVTSNLIKEIP
jgi:hypothetical protein